MNKIFDMSQLAQKFVATMTGEELSFLITTAMQSYTAPAPVKAEKHLYHGINGMMELFGCSQATANRIKASGIINDAITQVGRKIIVDGDKALQLVREHQSEMAGLIGR